MAEPSCIFCRIIAETAPASIVYSGPHVIAFLDLRPVNPGHVLVVPREHASSLAELDPDGAAHLVPAAMRVAAAIRRSGVRCEGINLMVADGAAAGQTVYHVHLHVVPRFRGDGFGFRLGPESHRPIEREALERMAAAIRAGFEAPG